MMGTWAPVEAVARRVSVLHHRHRRHWRRRLARCCGLCGSGAGSSSSSSANSLNDPTVFHKRVYSVTVAQLNAKSSIAYRRIFPHTCRAPYTYIEHAGTFTLGPHLCRVLRRRCWSCCRRAVLSESSRNWATSSPMIMWPWLLGCGSQAVGARWQHAHVLREEASKRATCRNRGELS